MRKINAGCVDDRADGRPEEIDADEIGADEFGADEFDGDGLDDGFGDSGDLPEPVRIVSEAALRNAVLVLDAVAATLRAAPTGPVNKAAATADQIRIIIDAVESGRRLDLSCCANPWRAVLARHLLPPERAAQAPRAG
ncbi:hypothetical protein LX15_004098 [Streptoalloteichus tenebrarius]|uniref:Uncharacterized protein n=1 Tax=Streptoalloteichus tenebrarius (strain ATCC 17920 / DSM 40477 / JCM 4838 / CBS 697.72 / NBRC 16177 / NCIMB 11028 / NRRL B-12390 / A12253. 1 / ISP 5477) TaxID=1933 RepID=A0ABT1HXY9_STRSD|nr:hypothetical protein [Streptoalloteichus tenebrarius]MCP2260384.1 hypothetical protein [Streptoalloteichus tenebrarius]